MLSFHATEFVELADPQLLHQTPLQPPGKLIVQYGQSLPDPQLVIESFLQL